SPLSLHDALPICFERVQAVLASVDELERRTREQAEQAEIAKLDSPLDGYGLMAMFNRPPGPWLGKVKSYLRDLVIDGELDQNDKERGAELARAYVAEHPEL